MTVTPERLSELRATVAQRMSTHRYKHTLGVERAAARLGSVLLPDAVGELRVAALLHDLTKELDEPAHRALLADAGLVPDEDTERIVALLHAKTAVVVIQREFADLATERILSSVCCHTAGRERMSVFDKIIFIADYIEDGRTYSSCVSVREHLYASLDAMQIPPIDALNTAVLAALDHTITTLVGRGARISKDTFLARNALLDDISHS